MANVYSYVQLAEAAEAPHRRHNLWAVVAECSVPRPTRGTGVRRLSALMAFELGGMSRQNT